MARKTAKLKILTLVIVASLPLTTLAKADVCERARWAVEHNRGDLIQSTTILTHALSLYSVSVEESVDCKTFTHAMTVKGPDIIQGPRSLCAVLSAGELKPGICKLRVSYCVTPNCCKTTVTQLKWIKGWGYVRAQPAYQEFKL
ncbi:hypothetical protein BGC07_16135 [Piscirickettsia litoralis]|uniref:Uncharacterized protein n=2 Tax=Piscirickettsia litoralis TaxID=1891921 RepID=A0ABX2ZYE3_9GAMM|nr:hypothetical protein BGC07_16135 [Piscirickettsia litoralis]